MNAELQPGRGPGQWYRTVFDELGPAPRWGVIITCLECKRPLVLLNHTIGDDGQVFPSVGHPEKWSECPWHPTPKLLGWQPIAGPNAIPPPPPPKLETCEKCGVQSHVIAGWGTWSGGGGIICKTCFQERAALTQ